MTNDLILDEFNRLPEHLKMQVLNYIQFLKSPFVSALPTKATKKLKFGFGKSKIIFSADFDEPLDDFKNYM